MTKKDVDWDFDEGDLGEEHSASRARRSGPDEAQGEVWLRRALGLGEEQTPFPWQVELLRRFMHGEQVHALDIPTGLGKTATMAVWLVARTLGAQLPRRLVYVVDRRAVVDQATEVAEALRAWVQAEAGVADALGLAGRALPISTLRGQHVDNRAWLEDPSAPAIVVGTVDMVGSRLLFEGYRCSHRMRPYHAGLLGADALIVVDEAHLVPAFEAMARAAADDMALGPQANERKIVPRSRLLSLSATGRTSRNTLQLGDTDREHAGVRRRLDAQKRIRLTESVEADTLAKTLAEKAWELSGTGALASRTIVFVDSRKKAQSVRDFLERMAKGEGKDSRVAIETVLLVGGRRVAERQRAAEALRNAGVIAGSGTRREHAVFVVATSAGEVGVDLDADHAVLDLVEWERMVQRLGRVNRRGEGEARVWVVPPTLDAKTKEALAKEEKIRVPRRGSTEDRESAGEEDDDDQTSAPKKLNAEERGRVERWRRLEATRRAIRHLPMSGEAHDASPRALTRLREERASLVEEASTPAPLHPELTRAVVEAWSMTSLEEHTGRPSIRPWLRGWVEEEPQTALVWRSLMPSRAHAKAFFEAAPVETVETLEIESRTALDWLGKRARSVSRTAAQRQTGVGTERSAADDADERGRTAIHVDDVVMYVLDERHRGWTVAQLADKAERDALFREICGETVVVDTRLGGLDENGLLDVNTGNATDAGDNPTTQLPFRVRRVDSIEPIAADPHWRMEDTFVSETNDEGDPIAWLVVETDIRQPPSTADARSTGREQRLDEHQAFAERHARSIGERAGLEPGHVELLALAAALHDEGKKAERWQRAFQVPVENRPLAKTTSRPLQSILARYRHELGSLPYAERDPRVVALPSADRDLVLHLIAAHHGFARPLLRTDGCDEPPSALNERARGIALRFARLEKRWGPWGLAWWEALLRAADQGASRENDDVGGSRG